MSDKTVEVLLAEYHACQMNRDTYHNIVWTIGSIFIAASFTLLGISFVQKVIDKIEALALLACFSLASIVIWNCYTEHVRWYIKRSIERMWDIERELKKLGFSINLHTSIKAKKQISARWTSYLLTITMFAAWIFRILISYDWFVTALLEHSVTLFFGLTTWIVFSYFILYVYYKRIKQLKVCQTKKSSS